MLQMMQRMMGQKPGEGDQPGQEPGDNAGQGGQGDSDAANEHLNGENTQGNPARQVPKTAGTTGQALPEEFQQALDAYNKAQNEQK